MVAAVVAWRHRPWRTDPLGLICTVGAAVPLVLLVVVADLVGPDGPDRARDLFPTQNAVVTASLGTLAWLVSRGARWPVGVAVWTIASAGVVAVTGARLYLGWSTASGTVSAVLLGAAWTTVFVVAWSTRERAGEGGPPAGVDADPAGSGAGERLPRPRERRPASRGPRRPVDPC